MLRTLTLLALACLVPLSGCELLTDPNDEGEHVGIYMLLTADGLTLPIVLQETDTYRLEVTTAEFAILSDGTYAERVTYRERGPNDATQLLQETTGGSYQRLVGYFEFVSEDGHEFTGLLERDTLTVQSARTFVYTR